MSNAERDPSPSTPATTRAPLGVAVVTGGTAGIGRATVRELARVGYDVAVLARGRAGLEGARADVEAVGRRCLTVSVDVADSAAVERAADRVEDELGEVEVWVNVAFVGSLAYFWETSVEEFHRLTDVTYHGQVNGMRAALRLMRPRDRGSIVNVSSAMAYRSIPLQSAYCGAKHAVKGVTESVVTELRATGSSVRVSLVTLPGVNTPQFNWNLNRQAGHPMPVPPLLQPEVAARTIARVAQKPKRNSWVGIAAVYTVLGNRFAPSFMDVYLGRTGVDAQQTDQDAPHWGSNLHVALDEDVDRGARGPFSDQASEHDPVSFLGQHRTVATAMAAGVLAAGLGSLLGRRR